MPIYPGTTDCSWISNDLYSPAKPAIACATDETKLRNSDEILLLGLHVCTKISVRPMIGLLKGHCGFANQGKRKFETHFR